MKNIIAALGVAFLCSGLPKLYAEESPRTDSDIVTWQVKADSDVALGVSSINVIYATEGLVNFHETFVNVPILSTSNILSVVFTTAALTAGASNIPTEFITQPLFPTVLRLRQDFNSIVSSISLPSTCTISGFDAKGSSRTINVLVGTRAVTSGVAFATISSITFNVLSSTHWWTVNHVTMRFVIGSTRTFGLANDIESYGDIYKVLENNVNVFPTVTTVDPANDTISFNAEPTYNLLMSSMVGVGYDVWGRVKKSPPHRRHPGR